MSDGDPGDEAPRAPTAIFSVEEGPCRWCGEDHGAICPWVKALEFDPAGNVTRVEFLTSADFPKDKKLDEDAPAGDYPRKPASN